MSKRSDVNAKSSSNIQLTLDTERRTKVEKKRNSTPNYTVNNESIINKKSNATDDNNEDANEEEISINMKKMEKNDSSSHEYEKCDAPEIIDKFNQDNAIAMQTTIKEESVSNTQLNTTNNNEKLEFENESRRDATLNYLKQSYAFTIDYMNDNGSIDADAKAAKYKNLLERFQNRHKRGASMSKIENSMSNLTLTAYEKKSINNAPSSTTTTTPDNKVTMRGKSAPRTGRDFGKRRSWSPRAFDRNKDKNVMMIQRCNIKENFNIKTPTTTNDISNCKRIEKSIGNRRKMRTLTNNYTDDEQEKNVQEKLFLPRSTVMQLALKKVSTQKPLLDDFKVYNLDEDNASETGTYTLDGDNYTEEQKEEMNIDKSKNDIILNKKYNHHLNMHLLQSPTSTITTTTTTATTATGISEQIHNYNNNNDDDKHQDIGYITSVTTSGVLAKNNQTIDKNIENNMKINKYFATTQMSASDYNNSMSMSMPTPIKTINRKEFEMNLLEKTTDADVLKTAPTKKVWIQEWARNARARSLANDYVSSDCYDNLPIQNDLISNDNRKFSKTYFMNNSYSERGINSPKTTLYSDSSEYLTQTNTKMQQTKIPSPLHSNRRTRSTSRLNTPLYNRDTAESPIPTNSPTHFHLKNSIYSLSMPPLQRNSIICTTQMMNQQQQQQHQIKINKQMSNSYNEQELSELIERDNEKTKSFDENIQISCLSPSTSSTYMKVNNNNIDGKFYNYYDDELEYYVHDLDDDNILDTQLMSVSEDPVLVSHYAKYQDSLRKLSIEPALYGDNVRYNRTSLLNKNKKLDNNNSIKSNGGAIACPNTPELPRRPQKYNNISNLRSKGEYVKRKTDIRDKKYVQREVKVPNTLALAKKHLLQTAALEIPTTTTTTTTTTMKTGQTGRIQSASSISSNVQPKYLDISKFKSSQANQFLRKNEARITLKTSSNNMQNNNNCNNMNTSCNVVKRSPTAFGLSRTESMRGPKTNVRSMPNCMTSSGTLLLSTNVAEHAANNCDNNSCKIEFI